MLQGVAPWHFEQKSRLPWFSVYPYVNMVLTQPHSYEQLGVGEVDLPYLCWKKIIAPDAVEQPKENCIYKVICQVAIEGRERRRNRRNLEFE